MTEVTLKTKELVFIKGENLLSRKKDYMNKEISTLIKNLNNGKVRVFVANEEITEEGSEEITTIKTIGLLGKIKDVLKFIEVFTKKNILSEEKTLNKFLSLAVIEEEASVKGKFVTETGVKFKELFGDEENNSKTLKVLDELDTVTYDFIKSLFNVVVNEETNKIESIEAVTKFEVDNETSKTKKVNIKKEEKEKNKQMKYFTDLLGEKQFKKLFR